MPPPLPSTVLAPAAANARGSLWSRLVRGRRVLHRDPDWDLAAGPDWADRVMGEAVADRFHAKQGRSIARWAVDGGGAALVVYLKRHYVLPRWRGLMAAVFPGAAWSPGLEEWERLGWARANGLPVPRAVAVGELLGPWGRLQSFLAVEELTDMLPLHEAIPRAQERLSAVDFARWKRGLVAELARLARQLHARRAYHRDLYLCHFYVPAADTERVPNGWSGRVWMIDFHRLTRRRFGSWALRVKDLAQLLYSTFGVPGVTDRDRARFWADYARPTGGSRWRGVLGDRNWTVAAIVAKARRYRAHNDRKAARTAG